MSRRTTVWPMAGILLAVSAGGCSTPGKNRYQAHLREAMTPATAPNTELARAFHLVPGGPGERDLWRLAAADAMADGPER